MSGSVYALLPQLASIMRTFNQLGAQHTSRLLSQLHQYGDLTDGQVGWMRLKAGAILTTAFLSGATGIATGFFPKGASNPTPTLDPRLGANSAVEDMFQTIANKLTDNDFMRQALKAASKNIHEFGSGANILFDMPTTEIEAKRTIMTQVRFQSAQDGQNSAQSAIDKANQLANSIIEKKGRGA